MTTGTVTLYNPRRGTGYVRHDRADHATPFSLRHAAGTEFADGDRVEFAVVGGLAGVAARGVRRIADVA